MSSNPVKRKNKNAQEYLLIEQNVLDNNHDQIVDFLKEKDQFKYLVVWTAIVEYNNLDLAEFLIKGSYINAKSHLLMNVCIDYENDPMISLLMYHGANIQSSRLIRCCARNRAKIKFLLDRQADPTTVLIYVCKSFMPENADIVQMCFDAGADPNALNGKLLYSAIRSHQIPLVKLFIQYGADISLVDQHISKKSDTEIDTFILYGFDPVTIYRIWTDDFQFMSEHEDDHNTEMWV